MSHYSEGQAHQVMNALEKAGFTAEDLAKLGQFKKLPEIRELVNGLAEIIAGERVIDDNAEAFIPKGYKIEEHRLDGPTKWDASRVSLYMPRKQEKKQAGMRFNGMDGIKLRKKLQNKPVLNANVLDFLLKNPLLIPEDWKEFRQILFWGTIYRDENDRLYVGCLSWSHGKWSRGNCLVDDFISDCSPAAILSAA